MLDVLREVRVVRLCERRRKKQRENELFLPHFYFVVAEKKQTVVRCLLWCLSP